MPPLSALMEMAFLLQISASPIEVNFNADLNEKLENIYSIYYPTNDQNVTLMIFPRLSSLALCNFSQSIDGFKISFLYWS